MPRHLALALVQAPTQPGSDFTAFAAQLRQLTRENPNTRLYIYPELHLCNTAAAAPDEVQSLIEALAEPLDGPRDRALSELARELGIWLVPGSFYERGGDGRIYNTTAVYSPLGDRVAHYRKIFPWRPSEKVSPGSEFVVFDMEGFGRIGLSICYDAWFPESSRHLAWMGAELILNVVQTPTPDRAQELTLVRANAIVNQVFVASVNTATPGGLGRSLLVDPQGNVRTEAPGAGTTVLTDVIDLDDVATARQFGTAGVTFPWQQFTPADPPLELPLYSGRINPETWKIQNPTAPGEARDSDLTACSETGTR